MDAYPEAYIAHNLPLVVLSGLEQKDRADTSSGPHNVLEQNGAIVSTELPPVSGEQAKQLLQEFLNADGRDAPWHGRPGKTKSGLIGFRIRAVGREFRLPTRKAAPPPFSPDFDAPNSSLADSLASWALHSPISPLSPGSPIYPDGVMTPLWIAKHQYHIPSVFISFFAFTSDPTRNSLHDNQLKSEINSIKASLSKSDYKTRYAVVLLSDKTILEAPDIEDRLANIRRATGLDPKNSLFFLPPDTSRVEIASFVTSILTTLQPLCVEYYRDLTKHARRKKNRGQIPPPTVPPTRGTSQTLSAQGWAVRYEFKLGVFAEFRQEMDAAGRHYTLAFDVLLGSDGVFETTASWSPRWDEARLLADTIAIRIIRCLLWNNLPTSAVQSWVNYRDRIRDLVDRRGKGSSNYGWEAWESRWAKVMAEIMQKAELPAFAIVPPTKDADVLPERENVVYAAVERAIPIGERLPPWHQMHHAGYWLRLSAEHAMRRRQLAESIPDEDRTPPGQSPATMVASRYGTYDTYLCPEPHVEYALPGNRGFDHTSDIVETLNQAISEFYARGQQRFVDKLQFDVGKALISAGSFSEALSVLKPVWEGMTWRKEQWWPLVSEVTWALHECATRTQDAGTVVATEWELLSRVLHTKPGQQQNLMQCLNSISFDQHLAKPRIQLTSENALSFLSVSHIFANDEGNVGEPLKSQVAVISIAHPHSAPVVLSCITVEFEGCLRRIKLRHTPADDEATQSPMSGPSMLELSLSEEDSSKPAKPSFVGNADLTFYPGHAKIFDFPVFFREAGDVKATNIMLNIETERFHLSYASLPSLMAPPPVWWLKGRDGLKPKRLGRQHDASTRILPKPPKMTIRLPTLQRQYYTDEPVTLAIDIANQEVEETEAVLEIRILNHSGERLRFSWQAPSDRSPTMADDTTTKSHRPRSSSLSGHPIGRLAPSSKLTQPISFTAPPIPSEYVLEIKVLYHLLSDLDTPISKTHATSLLFASPFEANYDFAPRVHLDPWPSFFALDDDDASTQPSDGGPNSSVTSLTAGIPQAWQLTANIASFALEPLAVEDVTLEQDVVHGGTVCTISTHPAASDAQAVELAPQAQHPRAFALTTRKLSLEDRRSAALDLSLRIRWRRAHGHDGVDGGGEGQGGAETRSVTTSLPVPRLHIPAAEPRVLASVSHPHSHLSSSLSEEEEGEGRSEPQPQPQPELAVDVVNLTYTLENPTMHFLTFELSMQANEQLAFSGPKACTVQLLPLSRREVGYRLLPLSESGTGQGKGRWVGVQLKIVDRGFGRVLRVLAAGEGVRGEKGGVAVWVGEEVDGKGLRVGG